MSEALVQALRDFQAEVQDWAAEEARLQALAEALEQELLKDRPRSLKLSGGETARLAEHVWNGIAKVLGERRRRWEASAPVRDLSKAFSDRVVLLVYGKVNAGKSTFINFMARALRGLGEARAFALREGRREPLEGGLATGVTETTDRIQGMEIGRHLVLLDTPGLHSVTAANAALARRYTDAADGVLWLTSSQAPGTVQELEALEEELRRGRPLQPVITQSDRREPRMAGGEPMLRDGRPVYELANKPEADRRAQERDVRERAARLLGARKGQLREPRSISIKACEAAGCDEPAQRRAGLTALFDVMAELTVEARRYKGHKARRQIVAHLERDVLEPLEREILSHLDEIQRLSEAEAARLRRRVGSVADIVISECRAGMQDIVARHQHAEDYQAIAREMRELVARQVQIQLVEALADYGARMGGLIEDLSVEIDPAEIKPFEDVLTTVVERSGAGRKAASTAAGAAAGAIAGGALGLLGVMAGSMLGAMAGGWLGSKFETEEMRTIVVGKDTRQAEQSLQDWLSRQVPKVVKEALARLEDELRAVAGAAGAARTRIERFRDQVQRLKEVEA